MEYSLQNKIYRDKKLNQYLKENSHWYKELNRNTSNFRAFYDEYKKYNRDVQYNKITSAVDALDTVNTIFKIIN